MADERVRYFVEGECEKKLIDELKRAGLLPPGKSTVFNVLTQRISFSRLMEIERGSFVIFVFDTDVENDLAILRGNIQILESQVPGVRIIKMIQVRNLEDELKRATNIKQITDITGSKSIGDFKSDFLRLKSCVTILNRHGFDISKMWCTKPEGEFASFSQDFSKIRRKTKKK